MKRSAGVHLILLGSVGLFGCEGTPENLQQQKYTSFDQCRHDWGDPADCTPSSSAGQSGYYVGPRYYWDSNSNRPVAVAADGSTRSIGNSHISSSGSQFGGITSRVGGFMRGGFGSFARSFGGGRS